MEAKKQVNVAIDLNELVPQNVEFSLSSFPDRKFTIGAYTLRVQLWAQKLFGKEKLEAAMSSSDAEVLSQLAYYTLKEKTQFPKYEDFLDAIVTYADRSAVMQAILGSAGLSKPVLEKLAKQIEQAEGNGASPGEPAGAPSTTP